MSAETAAQVSITPIFVPPRWQNPLVARNSLMACSTFLAMFVANLAPILIVAGAAGLDSTTTSQHSRRHAHCGHWYARAAVPPRGPY